MQSFVTAINWFAVLGAAFASLIIGFVWYLPPVFGQLWANLVKSYGIPYASDPDADPLAPANPLLPLLIWLVGFLVNATVLAIVIEELNLTRVGEAVLVATLGWLAFGATLSSWPAAFARWPWGIWLINNGCFLVTQIVMAIIITLWQ